MKINFNEFLRDVNLITGNIKQTPMEFLNHLDLFFQKNIHILDDKMVSHLIFPPHRDNIFVWLRLSQKSVMLKSFGIIVSSSDKYSNVCSVTSPFRAIMLRIKDIFSCRKFQLKNSKKCWPVFYGISIFVGHLKPNPVYTHTQTHTYIYIYIYVCVCVCVCVCVLFVSEQSLGSFII